MFFERFQTSDFFSSPIPPAQFFLKPDPAKSRFFLALGQMSGQRGGGSAGRLGQTKSSGVLGGRRRPGRRPEPDANSVANGFRGARSAKEIFNLFTRILPLLSRRAQREENC